jgi:AhpD family alkylhydroperoxidase
MARIAPASEEEFVKAFGPDAPIDFRYFAHQPQVGQAIGALGGKLFGTEGPLPPRLTELLRIRVAFHNQCRRCMAVRYDWGTEAGVDEEMVCSLEKPEEAPDLTDAERAALAYADLFATNHLAIDDGTFDRLREHFSETEIVGLGMLCAYLVGFGRFASVLDIDDGLPDRFFGEKGGLSPWGGKSDEVVPLTTA